ncbi:MAG: phenylalanine--tRNA ligase subunit beta, partial [Opitutae bacterium]
ADAGELVDVLPMLGLEVEETGDSETVSLDHVVVGEVLDKQPHPEAERLSVCQVNVGTEEPANIVCGATNFQVGDRVAVALPGAKLPGGFKIKKSKLRGVQSEGMMCSAKELQLGEDDQGLMILSDSPAIGTPIENAVSPDRVLELEITANRGDCLSHIGVAREIAGRYQKELKIPAVQADAQAVEQADDNCLLNEVRLDDDACPYYTLWTIRGVKIGPSPEWMQKRLQAVGLRPINNVVDVTNYVLLETGQPLHAFDAKKIKGPAIIVRNAEENESITTLDEVKRTLQSDMLVIADAERPLVVAGVMGSVDAEVDDSTTDLVLESAWFRPGSVRSTARRLGLHSDSSQRFSRDVDPAGVEYAARRAIDLIIETAGGELAPTFASVGSAPRGERNISIEHSFVEKTCGFSVTKDDLVDMWKRLGFTVSGNGPWEVTVPSFRSEVDRPIDLVEEYLRLRGTEDLSGSQLLFPANERENDLSYDFCQSAIDHMLGLGYQECCHYSLRSATEVESWFSHLDTDQLALANPLTADHTHIRPSLLPGLTDALSHNQKNLNDLTRVCETGRVFRPGPRGNMELISVAFSAFAQSNQRGWKDEPVLDFFAMKNQVQSLVEATGLSLPKGLWTTISDDASWQDGYSARLGDVHKNKLEINLGIISLSLSKEKEAKGPVFSAELLIDPVLLSKRKKPASFSLFSTFPPAIKDLALVVDSSEPAETVRSRVEEIAQSLGKEKFAVDPVQIFDLFAGKGLPEGKKSLALTLRFRASDRTLGEKELNEAFEGVISGIREKTSYELRS